MNWKSPVSACAWLFVLFFPAFARAHNGPPFPIFVDQKIPGYVLNVLANPDLSQAIVLAVLNPQNPTAAQKIVSVDVAVQPVSGRLPKAVYHAQLDSSRGALHYSAVPEFDRQEMWNLAVEITLADGTKHPFTTQVEATPPGVGIWGFFLYLFPFILFGGLWVMVFLRKNRLAREAAAEGDAPQLIPDGGNSTPSDSGS